MKHVAGFPNSPGTRRTAVALPWLQSRRSGVRTTEQIRTKAVSTDKAPLYLGNVTGFAVACCWAILWCGVKTAI